MQILKGTPERAEVVPVKPRDIRRKLFEKNLRSQDRDMNIVSIKDIVRVSEGHYKVRSRPDKSIGCDLPFQASVAVLRTLTQN